MRISVIIVSYNVRELLLRCLRSVADFDQVIVVDNASQDGSPEAVSEYHPGVHLAALPENKGFSTAVNIGAAEARGDAFLLLNPDAALLPGAALHMRDVFERLPKASAVGFRQVDEKERFQLAIGPGPHFSLELLRRLIQRGIDRGSGRLAHWLDMAVSEPLSVPWVAGSCLLVRRDAFFDVGGFDEGFFLFFEDIDFCLRLRQNGGRVYYDPCLTLVHTRGASADKDHCHSERAYRESQRYFWRKHRGRWGSFCVDCYQRARGLADPRMCSDRRTIGSRARQQGD